MNDLVRYRAMESLCRQAAVHHPLESWKMLAEAERWHHKALDEIASRHVDCSQMTPAGVLARAESFSNARDRRRLPAG